LSPRVLIVDDSLTVRMDLSEAFDAAGFSTARCADLASARQALSSSSFSLIVLDVLLPDGDGIELLRELKNDSGTAAVPVMLLSTEAEVQDRVRGLQTGADEYVGKPYDTSYVIARAKELAGGAQRQPATESRVTVLVVEDSQTFRERIRELLEGAGYRVLAAATGEEALHWAISERPAAILVDSGLPGIDGLTVVRRIREDAILRRTPCLLLTASDDPVEELRALDAGADSFMRKGDGLEVVLARLAAVLRLASAPPALAPGKSVLGPKRILAVDDDAKYLQELAGQLRQEGYDVVVAHSGDEALNLLAVQPVDCILLDLVMPGLSGQETCMRIKSNPAVSEVPLLILTAWEDRDYLLDGINAGADDYLVKSSEYEVLGARVRAALRRKQFEDENRQVREQLVRHELQAADARAQRELAEVRAALLADLAGKNQELEEANRKLREMMEERALDQTRLRMALDAGQVGTFEWSLADKRVRWSSEVERIHGIAPDSFDGTCEGWRSLIHPEDVESVWSQFSRCAEGGLSQDRPDYETEYRTVWPDGSAHWVLAKGRCIRDGSGRPVRIIGIAHDITDRKRSEERLRQSQKLESIGMLAGGIAHDFNNLLVGVMGNASLVQEMLAPGDPAVELLDTVIKTSEEAAHLTRQMLAYAGKGKFLIEPVNLSGVLPAMSALVRHSISKKIALQLDLAPDLPAIEADRSQMQQIFMNLVFNASEAIGSGAGTITVRTGVEEVGKDYAQCHPEAAEPRPGRYVFLEVRDTGCGMNETTRAKVFDPFFSTKLMGRGLGLAAVSGIVRGHKGAITVSSAPGKGSCFTVLLPASESVAVAPQVVSRGAALEGAGTILVVDDENAVRELTKKALERYGYRVLLAESGPEAIDIFKRHPSEISLVILDSGMPGMSGEETFPELRRIRPEVKVLISSGYSEAETMSAFQGSQVTGFVPKPYTAAHLAERVKAVIG